MKKSFSLLFVFLYFCHLIAQPTAQWQQTNGPEGGTVYDMLRVDSIVYIGTNNGIWYSSNEGNTWALLNTDLADKKIGKIALLDGKLSCISTHSIDAFQTETNFLQSSDGGLTFMTHDLYNLGSSAIHKLWKNGAEIWIQTENSVLFKSGDGGESWSQVLFPAGDYIREVAVSGQKIVAFGLYGTHRSEDGQIWTTTADTAYIKDLYSEGDLIILIKNDSIQVSHDFGYTWEKTKLALFRTLGGIVRNSDGTLSKFDSYYYHSQDDGLHWEKITTTTHYYSITCGVELANGFLAGGNDGVFRLGNNNTQFVPSNKKLIATSTYSIASMSTGRLIVGCSNGKNWESYDQGLTWQPIKVNPTYPYGQPLVSMTAHGDTIWGAAADTLYRIIGNSPTWEKITDADTWFLGETFVRVFGSEIFLVEDAKIRRSVDGGATWTKISPTAISSDFRDIVRHNGKLFYSDNEGQVFRQNQNGGGWDLVQEIWSPGAHRRNMLGSHAGRLYLWSEYEAFYSNNDGGTWNKLSLSGLPLNSWGDPLFEPTDIAYYANLILVTVPFHGVYVSFDLGNTWEPFNSGLSNLRMRYFSILGNKIYLGSSVSGVWQLGADFDLYSGSIYYDDNQNGQKDPNELPFKNALVSAEPLGSYARSAENGTYSLIAARHLDSLAIQPPNAYATILPRVRLAEQPGSGYDFGIYFTPDIVDLSIDITNWEPFRPGFDNKFTITVENMGTKSVTNAQVQCVVPNVLSIQDVNPFGAASIQGDTITWTISNLAPFERTSLGVDVVLSATPMIGDILTIHAEVPTPGDVQPTNNVFDLRNVVVGSFDPNDKSAQETITPQEIGRGKPIEYVIRFENTGNFFAEKIVITDQLASNLNPSTFHFRASSHPCTWQLKSGGQLEFTFNDIFLHPNATGFVKFSIEADRDLDLNDVVSNTAQIFFDFNAPVITNTVKTTVALSVASKEPSHLRYSIVAMPNPASDVVRIQIPSDALTDAGHLAISDEQGKTILTQRVNTTQTSINLSNYPVGHYNVTLLDHFGNVLAAQKIVVVR